MSAPGEYGLIAAKDQLQAAVDEAARAILASDVDIRATITRLLNSDNPVDQLVAAYLLRALDDADA